MDTANTCEGRGLMALAFFRTAWFSDFPAGSDGPRPPTLSTREIPQTASLRPLVSWTLCRARLERTTSNVSSSKGSRRASPSLTSTRSATPSARAFLRVASGLLSDWYTLYHMSTTTAFPLFLVAWWPRSTSDRARSRRPEPSRLHATGCRPKAGHARGTCRPCCSGSSTPPLAKTRFWRRNRILRYRRAPYRMARERRRDQSP